MEGSVRIIRLGAALIMPILGALILLEVHSVSGPRVASTPLGGIREKAATFSGRTAATPSHGNGASFDWLDTEGPLLGGQAISAGQAIDLLKQCRCPTLPSLGPASPQHVTTAWTSPNGAVAFDFDDGREITYLLDTRSADQFAQDVTSE